MNNQKPRRIIFALFPGCEMLDLAGPAQAFYEAKVLGVPYEISYCAPTPEVPSAQGLRLSGLEALPQVRPGDLIILPGYPTHTMPVPARLVAWLRDVHRAGVELCSVCTGAFALGEAGALDGKTCTTHWKRVSELKVRYPRAQVVGNRLFVIDDGIVTSAGIAAGIDMALALIGHLYGTDVAQRTADGTEYEWHVDPTWNPFAARHGLV